MLRQIARIRHPLLPLADTSQLNALWRILFARTLPPDSGTRCWHSIFRHRPFGQRHHRPLRPPADAHAESARCAEASTPCCSACPGPVRLPRGVRQIMRFHDSVPVTDVDTVVNWKMAMAHSRLVRACAPDAIFVCNSPQSRDDLSGLDPRREKHAVVIPCALAAARARGGRRRTRSPVIGRHVTFRALGLGADAPPAGWPPPEPGTRYVMAVSTLEPRKNFGSLIRAWERVAARRDADLRLVLVGGAGWREERGAGQLRPGVDQRPDLSTCKTFPPTICTP